MEYRQPSYWTRRIRKREPWETTARMRRNIFTEFLAEIPAIEHEQARLVAAGQRLLRNQSLRQFVVEFRKPHLIQRRSTINQRSD